MSVREYFREKSKSAELRAFFETRLNRDDFDCFGFVPYSMISKPIPVPGGGEFKEFIMPGAFSLQGNVKLMLNHSDFELASTSNGTLTLTEGKDGIRFKAKLPPGLIGRDIKQAIDLGDLCGASVGFTCSKDSWSEDKTIRYVERGELLEISLCMDPCYPQASSCGKVLMTRKKQREEKPRKKFPGLGYEPKTQYKML